MKTLIQPFVLKYIKYPILAVIFRFIALLLIYSLCRLLFLLFNQQLFVNESFFALIKYFLAGIRFDLSAIAATNGIIFLLMLLPIKQLRFKISQNIIAILFIIINTIVIAFNLIDIEYFKFTTKRSTIDLLYLIFLSNDIKYLSTTFILDFWYLIAIWMFVIFTLIHIANKTYIQNDANKNLSVAEFLKALLIVLIMVGLSILGIRGGWQLKPINILTAANYAPPKHIPLVINTPFTMMKSIGKSKLQVPAYFSSLQEAEEEFNPIQQYANKDKNPFKHVILIILEGISKEHIGYYSNSSSILSPTPFIDSLIKHSYSFPYAFANGRKSIESLPSILSGIPALMDEPFITSPYSSNTIISLPHHLKQMGYVSSFYHGGNNGTMGFDQYAKFAGFDHYFGRNEYNNDTDFDGKWGIYDDAFFGFAAHKIIQKNKPSFSLIYTLSSHHPYSIPAKYKEKFTQFPNLFLQSVAYTDFSLRKMFEQLKQWHDFENTLFVVTADHTAESTNPKYQNTIGLYAVPLFFYNAKINWSFNNCQITQHCDIMPAILHLLQYNEKFFAYGNNPFDSLSTHFAINYLQPNYQLISKEGSLIFNENEIKQLSYTDFPELLPPINDTTKLLPNQQLNLLKSIIQSYNYRMTNNLLFPNQ